MRAFLVLLAFASLTAQAAGPTITGVSGASAYNLTGTATIYGGLAGPDCSSINGNGATCNNCQSSQLICTTTPLCPCNAARAYDGGKFRITLKKPDGVTGEAYLVKSDSTSPLPKLSTNNGDFVDVEWTEVANKTDATNSIAGIKTAGTTTATFNGKIFIDKDGNGSLSTGTAGEETTDVVIKFLNPSDDFGQYAATYTEGIGDFTPYPGDEKVYIEDIQSTTNFPTLSYGSKVKAVRVFHSSAGLASATVDSDGQKDMDVDSEGTLSNNTVTGLENSTSYVFRVGLLDEANNVVQFFPAAGADATCDAGSPFTGCPWAATPEQVLGLLTDDINCFVATAAYGSTLEPKLKTFRDFRYKVLLRHEWGRKFVDSYYKYGPMAARFIYDKPFLRAVARGALWPLYGFAYASLKFGFLKALICGVILLMALGAAGSAAWRRRFGKV